MDRHDGPKDTRLWRAWPKYNKYVWMPMKHRIEVVNNDLSVAPPSLSACVAGDASKDGCISPVAAVTVERYKRAD